MLDSFDRNLTALQSFEPGIEFLIGDRERDVAGPLASMRGQRSRSSRLRVETEQHSPRKAEECMLLGMIVDAIQSQQVDIKGPECVQVAGVEACFKDGFDLHGAFLGGWDATC